jgi:hypothetical protein
VLRRLVVLLPCALVACGLDVSGTGDGLVIRRDSGVIEDAAVEESFVPPDDTFVEPSETSPVFDAEEDAVVEALLPGCTLETRSSHEYLFCELDANWDQARTSCQLSGYDLVIVNDKAEHDWILDKLKSKSRNDWHIGLSDRDDEGTFKWVDGTKPGFTSWATWEPNDFLFGEDCTIVKKDGAWNDVKCTGGPSEAFICETP